MIASLVQRIMRLKQWLAKCATSNWQFSPDPATQAFCLSRLHQLSHSNLIEQKVSRELGQSPWRAPNRLVIIVSETDPLGTLEAVLAGYIIGCKMRVKARISLDWLQQLSTDLALSQQDCEIYDWQSDSQNDEQLLTGVDMVLLAGGEALIRHYRQVTPPHIRLIELGPKISAMAITGKQLPQFESIINDTCLFHQQVCSSPRFILLDQLSTAQRLYQYLCQRIDLLPPLATETRLQQMAQIETLKLSMPFQSQHEDFHFSPNSGWAIGCQSHFDPSRWVVKGFQLIVSPLNEGLSIAEQHWPGRLQTLGYSGELHQLRREALSFTRYCPIGTMHQRPALAAHDGFFMLSALVFFISQEGASFE